MVTGITIIRNGRMRSVQGVKTVVIKRGWRPGSFRMAGSTIHRELRCYVVWIGCTVIIGGVTTRAGIGRIDVIALMAGITIIRDVGVGPV